MVLFINININQRVEVIYKGEVHEGTVKYKGGLTNTTGDWVGLDLDEPGEWVSTGKEIMTLDVHLEGAGQRVEVIYKGKVYEGGPWNTKVA